MVEGSTPSMMMLHHSLIRSGDTDHQRPRCKEFPLIEIFGCDFRLGCRETSFTHFWIVCIYILICICAPPSPLSLRCSHFERRNRLCLVVSLMRACISAVVAKLGAGTALKVVLHQVVLGRSKVVLPKIVPDTVEVKVPEQL
ncbi:hypothetical protein AVEN_173848-1 [Araneus ventricosus]|uniref:Uncharacterized protein n=1 Tax=Araneus ventricosus TaxID=182803 RepID=A0A4Y2QB38_ARAVE|nr:hypothetical protein AVEN_173848-1 [Araneus ventricosus]